MQRSIATTFPRPSNAGLSGTDVLARFRVAVDNADAAHIGLFFVTLALGIYVFSNPSRSGWYNHFVWQADAFLHGRFGIAFPVVDGPFTNGYFQDVMPLPSAPGTPSFGLLPFPPLPALLLMPFVAFFGLATDAQLFGVVIGAFNVGLAWRMTSRLTDSRPAAFLATVFFAFGTVHWYASILSTTWFLAHVVAITFVLLGVTLALDGERQEQMRRTMQRLREDAATRRNSLVMTIEQSSLFLAWFRRVREHVDPLQFMAGFVFGIGALARLPVIFGAPFFVFVGGGGSYWRRGFSAALGAMIPLGLLLLYNFASTGHVFNPAYEWLYHSEYLGYMPRGLEIDRSLGLEDPGHIPINALIMFLWPPVFLPNGSACGVGLLSPTCPLLVPSQVGMSLLLTSPAYLLAIPVVGSGWRRRLVMGAAVATVSITVLNLMHFSQGWVQFGYRFSNDFAPFALILVTLGIARLGVKSRLAMALIAASIIINAWGVYWGVTLGW